MRPAAEDRAEELFARTFEGPAEGAVRSPGRVNVIGDHTDYNDGFVLPIAIDRETHIVFRPRSDGTVHVVSEHGPPVSVDLGAIAHAEPTWAEYVRGVAWAMNVEPPLGWEGAIGSDVPIGAGLSSSASLELAVAVVFDTLANGDLDPVRLATMAQRAEREWVGMECGIMDQLSVAAGTRSHALLIDCRSLDIEPKPVPTDTVFVVLDTATRRELTSSAYNERRATCERAAVVLGVASLRDVGLADVEFAKTTLDGVAWRRVRHVVHENDRVLSAAAAMERGDVAALGRLMTTSHQSLRDNYEASSPELDAIVSAALDAPGCLGARMTGAGFGGCAVALVERARLDAFTPDVIARYCDETGLTAETYACVPAAGVSVRTRPAGGA